MVIVLRFDCTFLLLIVSILTSISNGDFLLARCDEPISGGPGCNDGADDQDDHQDEVGHGRSLGGFGTVGGQS